MERIKPRTLSGFMELLPARQALMERMMQILRDTYSLYGFAPLDTPAIEDARIAYNEIDLVLLFADPNNTDPWDDSQMIETIRHCDNHNVPMATNLASAEMLIMGLQRGDLDWRDMLRKSKF